MAFAIHVFAVILVLLNKAESYISEGPFPTIAIVGETAKFRCTVTIGRIYWFVNQTTPEDLLPAVRNSIRTTYTMNGTGESSVLKIKATELTNNSQIICADASNHSSAQFLVQGNLTSPVNVTAKLNDSEMVIDLNWIPPFVLSLNSNVSHNVIISAFVINAKRKVANCTALGGCEHTEILNQTTSTTYKFGLIGHNVSVCDLTQFEFVVSAVNRVGTESGQSDPADVEIVNDTLYDPLCNSYSQKLFTRDQDPVTESRSDDDIITPLVPSVVVVVAIMSCILIFSVFNIKRKEGRRIMQRQTNNNIAIPMCENESYITLKAHFEQTNVDIPSNGIYEDPDSLLINDQSNLPILRSGSIPVNTKSRLHKNMCGNDSKSTDSTQDYSEDSSSNTTRRMPQEAVTRGVNFGSDQALNRLSAFDEQQKSTRPVRDDRWNLHKPTVSENSAATMFSEYATGGNEDSSLMVFPKKPYRLDIVRQPSDESEYQTPVQETTTQMQH